MTSQSSLPASGGNTLRTREIRRSALVKVPSFSRNDEPGRKTCAYFAVSFRKISCTMTISIALSAAVDVLRVRIGLRDILALDVEPLEAAVERGVEHVRNAQAGLGVERDVPRLFEVGAHRGIGNVAIAGQLMRKGADVVGTLHVVLAAQRIDADARRARRCR